MTSISELSPGTWTVDPAHSEVGFVARHLMVSKVRGPFTEFEATVTGRRQLRHLLGAGHRAAGLHRHRQRRPRHAPEVRRLLRHRQPTRS